MITEDLIVYIRTQTKKNTPKDRIVARLTAVGWHPDDIAEGFAKLTPVGASTPVVAPTELQSPTPIVTTPQPTPTVTPMRIPTTPAAAPLEPKVWVPMSVNSLATGGKPLAPEVKPVIVEPVAEPVQQAPKEMPKAVPAAQQYQPEYRYQMPAGLSLAFGGHAESAPAQPQTTMPPLAASPAPATPTSTPAMPRIETMPANDALASSVSSILDGQKPMTHAVPDENVSERAMIASYKQDTMSAHQDEVITSKHTTKIMKRVLIGLALLVVVGGAIFAFAAGYIKMPGFTAVLVKKDPKDALLEASAKLGALHYYKSDISISLSSPSFAAITSGLVTGNSVRTGDLESVSVDARGEIANGGPLTAGTSSYIGTIKSSLLMDSLVTSWKYDGTTSYVDVPDLSELFPRRAPPPTTVAIGNGDLALLTPELSQQAQDLIKKVDAYNIVSKGISPYLQSQIAHAFAAFIATTTVTDKGEETIHDTPTYHYSIDASQPATKQFLTDLLNVLVISPSDDQKTNIDEAIGSADVDTFDVWVGKDDGILRQYDITLKAPLSKIIALEDKGISGKEVALHIHDMFYDFDVANDITMPPLSTPMADFVKSIRDTKIKSLVAGFSATAKSLSNAEGGYGKKASMSGSCTNPAAGSLFSPTGHTAGASSQVGVIATTMNTLLASTNNVASCYSTAYAWALSAPLARNDNTYYCADSTGATIATTTPLTGITCK